MKIGECIVYTLPKAVTSVGVSGKTNDVLKKIENWLKDIAQTVTKKDVSIKLVVPSELTKSLTLPFLSTEFGVHRVSGGMGKVNENTLTHEFWEFAVDRGRVDFAIRVINDHEEELKSLNPIIFVSVDFQLRPHTDVEPTNSNFILGLQRRSFIMPYIVFPFSESKDFDTYFEGFSKMTPFKLNIKHLRLFKMGTKHPVLRKRKLVGIDG